MSCIQCFLFYIILVCYLKNTKFPILTVLCCRGHQELQAVSAAIQTVLSTPVSVATSLKGIQKTLGKTLPFKVWRHLFYFTISIHHHF